MLLETAFDGREVQEEVIYDARNVVQRYVVQRNVVQRNVVQEVHVIEGGDVICPKPRFARQPSTTRPIGNDTRAFWVTAAAPTRLLFRPVFTAPDGLATRRRRPL